MCIAMRLRSLRLLESLARMRFLFSFNVKNVCAGMPSTILRTILFRRI